MRKMQWLGLLILFLTGYSFTSCDDPINSNENTLSPLVVVSQVNLTDQIPVPAPVTDFTVPEIKIDTAQFTGTGQWQTSDGTPLETGGSFALDTVYQAVVPLTAKAGYTFTGVGTYGFTHRDADEVVFNKSSGVVTVIFPQTASVQLTTVSAVDLTALIMTMPAYGGAIPYISPGPNIIADPTYYVSAVIDETEYEGTVEWQVQGAEWKPKLETDVRPALFAPSSVYKAQVSLRAKAGYTFLGIETDAFSHDSAEKVTNKQNSGEVTVVFPTTGANLLDINIYRNFGIGLGEYNDFIAAAAASKNNLVYKLDERRYGVGAQNVPLDYKIRYSSGQTGHFAFNGERPEFANNGNSYQSNSTFTHGGGAGIKWVGIAGNMGEVKEFTHVVVKVQQPNQKGTSGIDLIALEGGIDLDPDNPVEWPQQDDRVNANAWTAYRVDHNYTPGDGRWDLLHIHTVGEENGDNKIYVFSSEEPVSAQYIRFGLHKMDPGGSNQIVINAVEVYNINDMRHSLLDPAFADYYSFAGNMVSTQIIWYQNTEIASVTLGDQIVDPANYTVNGDTFIFNQAYLQTLAAGNNTFTFNFAGGDPFTFTVNKSEYSDSSIWPTYSRFNRLKGEVWTNITLNKNTVMNIQSIKGITAKGNPDAFAGLNGEYPIEATLVENRDYQLLYAGANQMRLTLTQQYLERLELTAPGYWTFKINFDHGATKDHAVFTVMVAPPLPLAYTRGTQSDIDYTVWNLQSPEMTSPFAPRETAENLVNREYTAWWYNDPADSAWDKFTCSYLGIGTGGSARIRCELREMLPGGGSAEWDPRGYNVMETILRGDKYTSNACAVNQIWGAGNQMEIGWRDNPTDGFTVIQGGSNTLGESPGNKGFNQAKLNSVGAAIGTVAKIRTEVINRVVNVYIDSTTGTGENYVRFAGDITAALQYYYFKAGNYDQGTNNRGIIPDLRDQQSVVAFKEVIVMHNPVKGRLQYYNGNPVPEYTEVTYTITGGGLPAPYTGTTLTDKDGYYWVRYVPLQMEYDTCASIEIRPPLSVGGLGPDKARLAVPARAAPITEVYEVPVVNY